MNLTARSTSVDFTLTEQDARTIQKRMKTGPVTLKVTRVKISYTYGIVAVGLDRNPGPHYTVSVSGYRMKAGMKQRESVSIHSYLRPEMPDWLEQMVVDNAPNWY
ncbi:hypothetical protein SEA_MINDFLAYER_186 [Streptomyces phage MindFlayer]|uniref:Uncharacterized protein n=3 Tax=Streptomyces virus Karimac TaxID=2846401 RepID=A0A5Q2WQI8_9CAUD|nr:hypothetical protein SEA_STARBOW_191 [Streptomyces phage Starbow]QGH79921.1 hypothetical protein SEA_BORDEAUX_192 [Streptomyces phage Bordeaux]QPL13790.1 hypothetical protein SEA_MINDFLAYER_186 [Streptomyces phage MindFlayer]QRI45838.1 hypothetical protein SEA_BATTUTA_191 [Streptomyces phage Battuta]URM86728.1 hypothetical protein SEA_SALTYSPITOON_192 [Streptomyces phage SaltySpitoon]URM87683.1 hypothetical protein SEA_QUARAN19_193 [Streptomyces phage Quaran19]WGH19945.1 hypothetical prote